MFWLCLAFNCFAPRQGLSNKHTAALCSDQRVSTGCSGAPLLAAPQDQQSPPPTQGRRSARRAGSQPSPAQPCQPAMRSAGQLCEGPGKGCRWASLKLPHLNLPLLRKHYCIAELEMKSIGGGGQLCSRVKRPCLGRCTFIHVLHRPGIVLLFRRARASPLTTHTFALCRVRDVLGTEAVFCGLPSGGSCRGGGGTLGPLSVAGE